jgi:hypothetical protein
MLDIRHYYCSNCNYHGDQEIQVTNKSEILLNPPCPVCKQNEFYHNILDYKLKDDDSEKGGISHSEYTLDEYLDENNLDVDLLLSEPNLKKLNNHLVKSGIKPIPIRQKVDYDKSPFSIDGLILEDDFSESEIIKINKFLKQMNDLKTLNNIKLLKASDTVKALIYELIDQTLDSFVYDICNYHEDYYTKDDFLQNVDSLLSLDPQVQHECIYQYLYDEITLKTFNYYMNNQDAFVELYIQILT